MTKINLRGLQKYTVMFILIILMVLFSFSSPYFLTVRNLTNILTQNTYFIILAIGLSFVMIGGGIDLSVGWQMSLVGVVTAMCMTLYHLPVWLSIVIGLLLGTFLGFFNGMIVANIQVFPLIVTIATSTVFQGISYIISHAQTYRQYPDEFLFIAKGKLLGMPFDLLLTLVIVLIASFIYAKTSYGWNVLAMGGNEEAARLAGIKTKAIKISVYTVVRFFHRHRHHGDDLQVEHHQLLVWTRHRVHRPDGSHRGRDQLHGRGRQHAGTCHRRAHPGCAGQRDAAGGLGNLCPVHCERHYPAWGGDLR